MAGFVGFGARGNSLPKHLAGGGGGGGGKCWGAGERRWLQPDAVLKIMVVSLVLKLLTELLQCSAPMPLCEPGTTSCYCWDHSNAPQLSSEGREVCYLCVCNRDAGI